MPDVVPTIGQGGDIVIGVVSIELASMGQFYLH